MKKGTALIEQLKNEIAHTSSIMDNRAQRINEGSTDMDDCFVSQRSNEQAISLAKAKIEILENGGLAPFQCLRDLETGEVVTTTIFNGKYGLCWRIDDAHQAKFGKYVGAASRESTYTRKGLKLDEVELPAWACFETNGTGMAGAYSAYVKIFPSRTNYAIEDKREKPLHKQLQGWDGHSRKGQAVYDAIFEREKEKALRQDCLDGICSCCEGSMYYGI